MAYKDKSDAIKYNNEYNAKMYDRINLVVPKGNKALIQEAAKQAGESTNEYINGAIKQRMERKKSE